MHLLAAKPGGFNDDEGIVDLQQSPGELIILSSQDSSLGLLAEVADELGSGYPEIRLANLINLAKPAAYDLYEQAVLRHGQLIVVSVLGGFNYWRYGVEQLVRLVKDHSIKLILVPGDDQPDDELLSRSTCPEAVSHRVWRYLREGGRHNTENLFRYLRCEYFVDDAAGRDRWEEPRVLPPCTLYQPGQPSMTLHQWRQRRQPDLPVAVVVFYRSHVQSGNTAAFDEFIEMLSGRFNVLALATLSLKDPVCLSTVNHLVEQTGCDVIINTTSFSQHVEGNASFSSRPQQPARAFEKDVPVIQAILAANSEEDWRANAQGLRGRDLAMNVALPEFDGRIISRALTFKALARHSDNTQIDVVRYRLHRDRARFIAELAMNWARLRRKPNKDKRVALILANYPTRDGRIGNGVGLDTPASTLTILSALRDAGYCVGEVPTEGDELIRQLLTGVTNNPDLRDLKPCLQSLGSADYADHFAKLPLENQRAIEDRWGNLEADPGFRNGRIMVPGIRFGNVFVGIQPARGFNVDVVANYHDPDLVPPHGYMAFYFWLRHVYTADAIAHVGKHGNLEWLPGKSVALSENCWPDAALGPLPHLYPFIVNDPGEGAQAKRRAQAVILDHLMPPMARAETYGELLELEKLIDEYYQALGLDQRREDHLRQKILRSLHSSNLARELKLNLDAGGDEQALLNKVDTYLCELKEAQIRHGLHCFGRSAERGKLAETLVALTRLPRGEGPEDGGILHCLASDLSLSNGGDPFDPLRFNPAEEWTGEQPELLRRVSDAPWRTAADTRERLELLAESLVDKTIDDAPLPSNLRRTQALSTFVKAQLLPAVMHSARNELGYFVHALNGGFVPAGPSGAPTRGRLDVLPTGRNFYSLDSRSIPTQSAWELGQRSAQQLIARHLQEHGDYPSQLGISVWGTSTMRTGGDDIAQALALMGVRPVWAQGSNRVFDVEIIPGFQLPHPRVDVTLRISGFFRDAFPNVARMFDAAVQALAEYEEPGDCNTIRKHVLAQQEQLTEAGLPTEQAAVQSRFRIFGSKPGSYGAGLQGLIDERIWSDDKDLAQAYVNWGGYSYSQEHFGSEAFVAFEHRLSQLEAVVHNQDNREHDLLDSDDYYQFQGGMANAVKVLKGSMPAVYHGDHSNPAAPKIRTLKEELNRVIRARVLNPKWIGAMREHGYKGAFEMAASVDYMFAYDATTGLIEDYQYEAVTDALISDEDNRAFLEQSNPNALKEMAERLLEAQQRGLWQSPGNYQEQLVDTLLGIENVLEALPAE